MSGGNTDHYTIEDLCLVLHNADHIFLSFSEGRHAQIVSRNFQRFSALQGEVESKPSFWDLEVVCFLFMYLVRHAIIC